LTHKKVETDFVLNVHGVRVFLIPPGEQNLRIWAGENLPGYPSTYLQWRRVGVQPRGVKFGLSVVPILHQQVGGGEPHAAVKLEHFQAKLRIILGPSASVSSL
jgi:hypothetical protein